MATRQATRMRRPPPGPARRADMVALAGIVALAAVLRWPTLDLQSFWIDEARMAELLRLPLGDFLDQLPTQTSPPLGYAVTWAWSQVLGTGEVGLRSLSALFGVATVPVAYLCGVRLASPRAGLVVAALTATSADLVWFSQEARPYALLMLLVAGSVLFLIRVLQDGRRRDLVWWALCACGALATHYFAVFVLAGEVVALLAHRRLRGRALAAVGALAVVGLALTPILASQAGRGRPTFYEQTSLLERVRAVPPALLLGEGHPVPATALTALGLLLAAYGLLRLRHGASRHAVSVAVIGVAALVVPVVLALGGADYIVAHNVLPALIPLVVAIGVGFAVPQAPRRGLVAAAATCALGVWMVALVAVDAAHRRDDWRGTISALGPVVGARAVVVPAADRSPAAYYLGGVAAIGGGRARVTEVDVVRKATFGSPAPPPLRVPAGPFRVVGQRVVQRLRATRLRAGRPQVVSAAGLARLAGTSQDGVAVLVDPRARIR